MFVQSRRHTRSLPWRASINPDPGRGKMAVLESQRLMHCVSYRARVARLLATNLLVASAAQIVMPAYSQGASKTELLPTGVFISPTAIPASNQQTLVPMIANWPANYAARGGVTSQLSPDGQTRDILH